MIVVGVGITKGDSAGLDPPISLAVLAFSYCIIKSYVRKYSCSTW